MALHKIDDRYPNYKDIYFDGGDLKGMVLYSSEKSRVGTVGDLLVDDTDRLKYLVAQLDEQKQVLVPVLSCTRTNDEESLYVHNLTAGEIYSLETYDDSYGVSISEKSYSRALDSSATDSLMSPVGSSVPVEMTVPVEGRGSISNRLVSEQSDKSKTDSPQRDFIPLYEERLSTRKRRVKTGEVKISKRVVTEKKEKTTPITKEKIIIEIESIYGGDTQIAVDEAEVAEDGSISMAIYEERAEVCRQVQPYQNISVRKEVVQDVVEISEELRREELSVNPEGLPYVDWVE
ncbi:MAG: DUF2382 domain-containing protein [Cyanobacteria bacterium J06621_11]